MNVLYKEFFPGKRVAKHLLRGDVSVCYEIVNDHRRSAWILNRSWLRHSERELLGLYPMARQRGGLFIRLDVPMVGANLNFT